MGKRILVVTGGEPVPDGPDVRSAPPFDLVIAADSGLDRALSLGLRADIVVGDLDSVSPQALGRARDAGSELEAHPAEKDHTDLELALNRAISEEASEIHVVGGSGGRPDHWLANLGLLAATARAGVDVSADMGGWLVSVVVPGRPYAEDCRAAQLVSLLPVHGDVRAITTEGLVYPLHGEDLPSGTSRGVSNLTCGGHVLVSVTDGTLLVMRKRDEVSR